MPDIGFNRSDAAVIHRICGAAERIGQGGHFNRITQIGAGAMAFDIVDGVGGHTRHRLRLGNCGGLPINRRGQIAGLGGPVIIDR